MPAGWYLPERHRGYFTIGYLPDRADAGLAREPLMQAGLSPHRFLFDYVCHSQFRERA
jgi:hypothetical protein